MIILLNGKVSVNVSKITHILKTNDTFIVYFEGGKPLHITEEDAKTLLSLSYEENDSVFFQFSRDVFIHLDKINYVKNNFENKKATKYKVTVYLPNGLEFFRTFELNDLAKAKELFSFLAQYE